MSDSFAGLTRRINEFVHERETSEELSHILDEAKDLGGDEADVLIELALGDEHLLPEVLAEDADCDDEFDAILEDDELVDGDDDDIEDPEAAEAAADADMASLVDDLEGDDDLDGDGVPDDDGLIETALQLGEVPVI